METMMATEQRENPAIPDPEPRKCRAVKHGGVTLHCTEPEGHDGGPDPTWHKAVYSEHREVNYDGAYHVIDMTERVTWEPVDHVAEAVRHLTAKRGPGDD
jgi:hypothetical protein